jgi:hypothetical protein
VALLQHSPDGTWKQIRTSFSNGTFHGGTISDPIMEEDSLNGLSRSGRV